MSGGRRVCVSRCSVRFGRRTGGRLQTMLLVDASVTCGEVSKGLQNWI
jgi:hypothetical protein